MKQPRTLPIKKAAPIGIGFGDLLGGKPLYLEYEKYDKWGNIRLKNRVTVTGVKIGDRVAESPGNGFLPVKAIGTVTSIGKSPHCDAIMVGVKWDSGSEWEVNADYLQLLPPNA